MTLTKYIKKHFFTRFMTVNKYKNKKNNIFRMLKSVSI
jgi:hypothetical protein